MKSNYEYITYLQYQCHNQEERIRSLESGAEYRKMEKRLSRLQGYYERQLKKKDRQIESLHRQLVHVREIWFQVFLDIQKECDRRIKDMNHILEKKEQLITEQKKTIKDQKNKISQKIREVTEERAKTNDEKEKNQKLQAQVDRNFKNSSTPSSQDPFRGKVTNNREKSGRKEGGQPGHEGHRRKVLPVTEAPVFIDAPSEIKDNPDYYKVKGEKGVVHKQVIGVHLNVTVTDYYADVYRNRKTGARYHAPFPEGISLEVNYDESVKALVFLLRNHLNVSIEKTREFLEEISDGRINMSHGKVCGINEEFSRKTKPEQEEIFSSLASSKVMYTDMTNVRHNGKLKNVVVCSNKKQVYYAMRDKKGDQGLKGTPVEFFVNLLVHDHDKTFYHYGSEHQDCNIHRTRYLRGAIEVETGLTWHQEMLDLLMEMETTRQNQDRILGKEQIDGFISRYDRILEKAEQEYYDNPPSKYYRKGYNLYKAMVDYKESVLCFLTNPEVDFSNNEAERCARKIKRHTVMSGSFRGRTNSGADHYCSSMSVMETDRRSGYNIFVKTKEYFKRNVVIRPGKDRDINPEVQLP